MHLSQLLAGIGHTLVGEGDIDIISLCCHTNIVKKGCLFFCMKGNNYDSHSFVPKVVADGAIAVVVDRQCDVSITQIIVKDVRLAMSLIAKAFYNNCADKMKLITVVGTNGKTSTTYLVDCILSNNGYNTGVIGSNGVFINGRHYSSRLTTPDPIELHGWLHQMYLNNVKVVIMEMSAHAIHYQKHKGLLADVAIFSNCTQDHLDFFVTMERYSSTKLGYFNSQFVRQAVVNIDDELGRKILSNSNIPVVSYCYNGTADVVASNYSGDKCDYDIDINGIHHVSTELRGMFNIYNTMSAIITCKILGVPVELSCLAIGKLMSVEGRNQTLMRNDGVRVVIDYAHTPDGINNILGYLRDTTQGQLIVVFGCGGNRDKFKRPIMGQAVSKFADHAIITNDNPRYERPLAIVADIESGIHCEHIVILNRSQATEYALQLAKCGDTVAILGKGAEKYQEIKGKKYPYSDKEVVDKLLNR